MQNKTTGIVIGALCLGLLGGYAFGQLGTPSQTKDETESDDIPAGMHRMHDGSLMDDTSTHSGGQMMQGMDHSMMMVTSEREFITEMIPHHQEAVDTALEVLVRGGTTAEIRTLAQNIVTAQEKEIADMKAWYQSWYGVPYEPSGNYKPMMRDLSTLSGAALDKAFLEDMVMHHMGAIMMAQSVGSYIEHEEVRALTQAIISTQSEEIKLMETLLTQL